MEQVNQIIDVLNWLRDNDKIDSNELMTLKDYYSKNHNDIDAIKDELLSFNDSHDAVLNKINEINKPVTNTFEPSINKLPKESKPEVNDFSIPTEVNQNELVQEDKPLENELVQTPVDLNKKEETGNLVNDFSNPIGVEEVHEQPRTLVSVQDIDKYIEATYSDQTIKTILNTLEFPGKALFIKLNEKYTDKNTITDMFDRITKDCPVISEVKDTAGMERGKRISLVNGTGYKLYDDKEAAKINILFFVFLMGLSLGMVAMIVLNYLKK